MVKFCLRARAQHGGKNPAWTSYEKLRDVIEKRMFSQVEDLLPVISFGTKSDTDQKHAEFLRRMCERGFTERQVRRLTEGSMLEFNHMYANVLTQPDFDDQRFSGLNPYALGFAMMCDIRRICTEPTDEDREWFPEFAGNGDWRATLRDAWANYRDESFILQYLSPILIRKLRLFALCDDEKDSHYTVTDIHDERGFRMIRERLARCYEIGCNEPNIQVVDVDLLGDRHLRLRHTMYERIPLAEKSRDTVLRHVRRLWGYEVNIDGYDPATDKVLYTSSSAEADDDGKQKEKAKDAS